MERLGGKELHGQKPVVTFPTKQALSQVIHQCLQYKYTPLHQLAKLINTINFKSIAYNI
jgi:hypothetical protein